MINFRTASGNARLEFLELDERRLARRAKSREARQFHLRIAEAYREMAVAALGGPAPGKRVGNQPDDGQHLPQFTPVGQQAVVDDAEPSETRQAGREA